MSREAPRFGEVFRWKSESQEALIMYVAPSATYATARDGSKIPSTWFYGVTLDENDIHLAGDVDKRFDLRSSYWSEVWSDD